MTLFGKRDNKENEDGLGILYLVRIGYLLNDIQIRLELIYQTT